VKLGGPTLKMYLLSLAVGVLVGILYALLNVRSPAPPIVALLGLLGMVLGEQAVPMMKEYLQPATSQSQQQSSSSQGQDRS